MNIWRLIKSATPSRRRKRVQFDVIPAANPAIVALWEEHIEPCGDFFERVILMASLRCPPIGATLRMPDPDRLSDSQKHYLSVVAGKVRAFLAANVRLSEAEARAAARQLGARHTHFSERKFKTVYWDVFVLVMTAAMEELEPAPSPGQIYAWQRYLTATVDQMRQGYMEEELIQRKDSRKEDVASQYDE